MADIAVAEAIPAIVLPTVLAGKAMVVVDHVAAVGAGLPVPIVEGDVGTAGVVGV